MTVKELNQHFEDLLKRIEHLEEKTGNAKVGVNEGSKGFKDVIRGYDDQLELLAKRLDDMEKNKLTIETNCKCKDCGKVFKNKSEMRNHVISDHPKIYICDTCGEEFNLSWKMEIHMREHREKKKLECDQCDKVFVISWRLEKHKKVHEENTKSCHYYNNSKVCPYEDLGCMFKHEESANCRFERNCRFKLCQFKHPEILEAAGNTGNNDKSEKGNMEEIDTDNIKYDELSGRDQFEVQEIVCDKLCVDCESWHRCWNNESDLKYQGINLKGITGIYDMKKQFFPCDYCNYKSIKMENVTEHFKTKHTDGYRLKCWYCEKEVLTMEKLKKHIGSKHYTPQYQGED